MNVTLIDYDAGNTRSVQNALKKIGVHAILSAEESTISDSDAVILPGVGNFGSAMERLNPLKRCIKNVVDSGIPFLGVCLGIQIILDESSEAPGVNGLGLIPGSCDKFIPDNRHKVPHMGWNNLKIEKHTPLLDGISDDDFFYFVHSYYPVPKDKHAISSTTEYNLGFTSVISEKNIFATQFHPEKSAEKGILILENFLSEAKK